MKPESQAVLKKEFLPALVWAALMLSLAFAAKYAHAQGYIDNDMALRIIAMNGLWMAYYGNRIPKKVAPSACALQAMRVSGWSMVLSGLVYAGLWAFAPIPVAETIGTGAVFAGVIVTLGYCVLLNGRAGRPAA